MIPKEFNNQPLPYRGHYASRAMVQLTQSHCGPTILSRLGKFGVGRTQGSDKVTMMLVSLIQ